MWSDEPTKKQLNYIRDIEAYLPGPEFAGKTRWEAAQYIDKYGKLVKYLEGIEIASKNGG